MPIEALPYGLPPSDDQQPSPWFDRASQIDGTKIRATRGERIAFLLPNGRKQHVPSSIVLWLATASHPTEDPISKREWISRVLMATGEDPSNTAETNRMLKVLQGTMEVMNKALAPYWGIVDMTPEYGIKKPHLYRLQKVQEEPSIFQSGESAILPSMIISLPRPIRQPPRPISEMVIPPPAHLDIEILEGGESERREIGTTRVLVDGRELSLTESAAQVLKHLRERPRQWLTYEQITAVIMEGTKNDKVDLSTSTALGAVSFLVKRVAFVLEEVTESPNIVLFDDGETSCFLNTELVEERAV